MKKTFILDQPISLKDGRKGHYAWAYNWGRNHYIFANGKTSWTVEGDINLCSNMDMFEIEDVIEVKEGYFSK